MESPGEVALLSARSLVRAGEDGAALFEPVSIELGRGDRMALRGPSGSGKTLVLRSLTLIDPPSSGEIRWRGEPIADADVPAHRRRVHLVAQSAPLVGGTVASNLALPFALAIADAEYDVARAKLLLERFGVAALYDRDVADLSGGERQIASLVRAMLVEPDILLLDEPTTALDPDRTSAAETLLDEWHDTDADRASIWVSHDAAQLDRMTSSSVTIAKV